MDWSEALDELERQLEAVEMLVAAGEAATVPWEPPAGLGPLPRQLQPRAVTLLERQRRALGQVTTLLDSTRQQLQATRRVGHTGSRTSTSVYLDVNA